MVVLPPQITHSLCCASKETSTLSATAAILKRESAATLPVRVPNGRHYTNHWRRRLWSKWTELIVQVGQQVNTHHYFSMVKQGPHVDV